MLVSLTAGFSFLHWVYFYSNNIHTLPWIVTKMMINTFQHNGSSSSGSQGDQAAVVAAAAELLLGGGTEQEEEQELLFSSSDFYNCNVITSPPPHVPNTFNIDQLDDDSFINYNLLFPSCYSSSSSCDDDNILPLIDVHNNDFQQFCYSNNYPKRQKIIYVINHQLVLPSSSDFVTSHNNHPSLLLDYAAVFPLEQPKIPVPPSLPQIPLPPDLIYCHSNATFPSFYPGDNTHKTNAVKRSNNVENVSLSAQSVAARQRRRKITEKTHQLGKLIPGASWNNFHNSNNKLNTADMFQAAFKYVKFLQAQVGVLQLMQEGSSFSIDLVLLEVLLTSPTMQEKLYLEEKCLVSNECLEILAKDDEILESYPLISNSLLVVHPHEHMESSTTTTT